MSIFGLILGGTAGLALGGPLGALLGAAAGYTVEAGARRAIAANRDATRRLSFTIGVIALSAKMARADGRVTPEEVAIFERLFHVPEKERAAVRRIFRLAQETTEGFEVYARQLAALFPEDKAVLEELVDALFLIAGADRTIGQAEEAFVARVSDLFGLAPEAYAAIAARHLENGANDPWTILGLKPGADIKTIKAAYRALAREHHPDRLLARGLPEEFAAVASQRMAAINEAYETLLERLEPVAG